VAALLEQLNRDAPDLVAVSGDLTQRARSREFEAARGFLDALSSPYLVVPGNHDMPLWQPLARLAHPWRRWRRHISPQETPAFQGVDFVAVGVNTARRIGSWLDWSRGRINHEQLATVARVLAQVQPDACRVLIAHHPFLLQPSNLHRGLVGRAEAGLVSLLAARVDLILGGHLHQGYAGVSRVGIGGSGPVVAQAATTVSERLHGGINGYNRIHIAPGCLDIEIMEWGESGFAVNRRQRFSKEAETWSRV